MLAGHLLERDITEGPGKGLVAPTSRRHGDAAYAGDEVQHAICVVEGKGVREIDVDRKL